MANSDPQVETTEEHYAPPAHPSGPPMKYLVVSRTHLLHPLARRLATEGMDVCLSTTRPRFKEAWAGVFEVRLANRVPTPKSFDRYGGEVMRGERVLVTDCEKVAEQFVGAPHVFGAQRPPKRERHSALELCCWWDKHPFALHFYIPDVGLWDGGKGPRVEASAAVVRAAAAPEALLEPFASTCIESIPDDFRGLVRVPLTFDGERWEALAPALGWSHLHTDLFVRGLSARLSSLLCGLTDLTDPRDSFTHRFYAGVACSIPPWPLYPQRSTRPAERVPLPKAPAGTFDFFAFHDFQRTEGAMSAGTDGLIGVSLGAGNTLERAQQEALRPAAVLAQLPEAQFRADVGVTARTALAQLDALGLWR